MTAHWTPAEDGALRDTYSIGTVAAMQALPHRTLYAIYRRAHVLNLRQRREWTAEEDERIRLLWGVEPVATLAERFGVSAIQLRSRAYRIGMSLGCPPGWVYVDVAADRFGLHSRTFRRALKLFGVKHIRPWTTRDDRRGPRQTLLVEEGAAEWAVQQWRAMETVQGGARRHNVTTKSLVKMLGQIGARIRTGYTKKAPRRWALSADIDRAAPLCRQRRRPQ